MGKAAAAIEERERHGNSGWKPGDPDAAHIPAKIAEDPRKMKAVKLLGEGAILEMTYDEIAAECGVAYRTLFDWRQDENFQEAVRNIARATLKDAVPGMYKTLVNLLKSKDPKLRLRAIELATKLTGELVERSESKVSVAPDAKAILEGLRNVRTRLPSAASNM